MLPFFSEQQQNGGIVLLLKVQVGPIVGYCLPIPVLIKVLLIVTNPIGSSIETQDP
jgi:hypothetical protein